MQRIFGLETEFGLTANGPDGRRVLSPEEAARYLFKPVIAWGRSSNVFLENAARLYLDVGSHPEYATAECLNVNDLIAQDKAGEWLFTDLVSQAQTALAADGFDATIHLFKNNTDSALNSYGCHENYLLRRRADFARLTTALVPFCVTRQILVGAGKINVTPEETFYSFSQRAEHVWDGVSSATTRSRPIINTRDEPHADAEKYRRLHVIVGDSNMSETTARLKVGATDIILRMIEAGVPMPDFSLAQPIRAIRAVSKDLTGMDTFELAHGATMNALEMQREYLRLATDFVEKDGASSTDAAVLDLWERGLTAVETGNHSLVAGELDWAIKLQLLTAYQERHALDLADPRMQRLDLAYHDIDPSRGLSYLLQRQGRVARVITDRDVEDATTNAPATTRAVLRGKFVRAARQAGRDFSVDWVHLKLNDESQRAVQLLDPFETESVEVDQLLARVELPPR